jgi:hypothetical protein
VALAVGCLTSKPQFKPHMAKKTLSLNPIWPKKPNSSTHGIQAVTMQNI